MCKLNLFILSSLIALCQAWKPSYPYPSCLQSSLTWNETNLLSTEINIATPEDCQTLCSTTDNCAGFTWLSKDFSIFPLGCLMLTQLVDERPCDNCVSGPPECLCTEQGVCIEQDNNMIGVDLIYIETNVQTEML